MGLVVTKIKIKKIALDFWVLYLCIRSFHSINSLLFCSESMHLPGLVLSYFRRKAGGERRLRPWEEAAS